MPKELEEKLGREAEHHGYKKGSKHYNAYVYGTLNAIAHNKAGGPEKVFSHDPFKMKKLGGYDSTHPKVKGIHIGITVAIILVVAYYIVHGTGLHMSSVPSPAQVNPFVPSTPYPGWADYTGWQNTQYNQLGAYAGALHGEGN
jgi:hypothetical protein